MRPHSLVNETITASCQTNKFVSQEYQTLRGSFIKTTIAILFLKHSSPSFKNLVHTYAFTYVPYVHLCVFAGIYVALL